MQQHPRLDLAISARALAKREALMSAGKSSIEARIIAYAKQMAMPTPELIAIDRMASAEIKRLVADGETDGALLLSGQILALAQQVQQEPSHTAMGDLAALSLQGSALGGLPEDVEIGNTGRTAKQQLASLGLEHAAWTGAQIEAAQWHLQQLDEGGIDLFFQIKEQRGDAAALRWAETYNGPAPKPEPPAKQ